MNNVKEEIKLIGKIIIEVFQITPFTSIYSIFSYLLQGLMPAFSTYILSKLFNNAFLYTQGSNTSKNIFTYGGLFLFIYGFIEIIRFINGVLVNAKLFEKINHYNSLRLGKKAARLSLFSFENPEIINAYKRANSSVKSEYLPMIYIHIITFLTSSIGVLGVIIILSSYSIWFLPISMFSVLPYFISRIIRGKEFYQVKKLQAKKQRRLDYLWSLFTNKQSVKEMRVMEFNNYLIKKWMETRDDVYEELWMLSIKDSKLLLFCDGLRIFGYVLSIIFALYLTLNNIINIGVFGVCIAAFRSAQNQIKNLLIQIGNLPTKLSFASDFYYFLNISEEQEGNKLYTGLKYRIDIKNLFFKYPNRKNYALKNINLSIKKGEKVAIIGENGCGKTTLIKLILGLYPIKEGGVYFDYKSITSFKKNSFYKYVTAIAQNFVRYKLTLRENIAISNLDKINDNKYIRKVIIQSGLNEEIFNNCVDNIVGKEFGGLEFSGGQWQRIALARTFCKNSELIILDEPTSALDPIMETEILSKFIKTMKNKTSIVISHRVGLCKYVDKIVVMKNGKIAEIGRHNDLINNKGVYYQLYSSQEKWYKE